MILYFSYFLNPSHIETNYTFCLSHPTLFPYLKKQLSSSIITVMEPPENDIITAEQIILRWDTTASEAAGVRMIFESDREEVKRYLQAVDQILISINSPTLSDDHSNKLNNAIQIAMARLEDEFRNILITNSTPIETETSNESISFTPKTTPRTSSCRSDSPEKNDINNTKRDDSISRISSASFTDRNERSVTFASCRSMNSIREQDLLPPESIADLRCIAERMIAAGYYRECVQVYGSVRKSVVDGSFKKLGVEKLSIGDIQRLEWEALNAKIGKWIVAAKACIRVLFASEKKLCKQIFEDLGSTAVDDACFMETVKSPANQLFNFAEAISISRRSPEKLFKILDLHDSLLDLLPDIDDVFDSKLAESVRIQAPEILSRLVEAARGMISEFENAVLREPSRVPVPGGTIHPLTRYVMNYISLISDYKQTLGELIVSKPTTGSRHCDSGAPDMDFDEHEGRSPFALHLIWIITLLHSNLEGKSKHYKDNSLAHLFIMNNVHYIVQKIKGSSELREMIGDNYLRTLTRIFRQAATNHQRATWIGVLHCLRDEGLHSTGSFSSGVSKSALRARFKSFNAIFDEVHRTQALWLIPDEQLREELRISILEKLSPAYRSFLGRFRNHISDNYIKYTVEDLENAVLDLFEGNPVSQHSRRKSH
ncbi:putative exocyst complex component Exo70, cullin repeat-like-containing domain superfamily [Helianthus annuus]|nr:putative exocyst complex component Exo70, cullin repeat-like-containing domain superfamily [Helianthus annuus]KAJ0674036.1 putative exocyst complex component Exo70, cullin repeat-like-containing domain superfamily [Helianthus annuus]